jgi:Tol biopolymer transport system component
MSTLRSSQVVRAFIPLGLAVAMLLAGLAGAGAAGSGRRAALPKPRANRTLVIFVSASGGLCLVRADGSHRLRLTPRWKGAWSQPSWSPKGRYVASERLGYNDYGERITKIVVADSRGHIRWTFGSGNQGNGGPLWSPDGRHIAYFATQAHSAGLLVARPDGSDEHNIAGVSFGGRGPGNPAWTPDGQRLAFDDGEQGASPLSIYSVRFDGSDRRLLVADAVGPAFSPDGSKLAYVSSETVLVADADGSNPSDVAVAGPAFWGSPAWSPDGTLIAFARGSEIVVVRADGSGEQVVASHADIRSSPAWSPGGRLIAFSLGTTRKSSTVVVVKADGSGERIVARHGFAPAWRPAVALPSAKRLPCR